MEFVDILNKRQSCRNFDGEKEVEAEKLSALFEAVRLSPSACNSQPYFVTVCKGEAAKKVAVATQKMGANKFASDAPVMLVISENDYNKSAAVGAKAMKNDFRSIDIGIVTANIVSYAEELGLASCIIGWLDEKKIKDVCGIDSTVRLVIALGYAAEGDRLRTKRRKSYDKLLKVIE